MQPVVFADLPRPIQAQRREEIRLLVQTHPKAASIAFDVV